MNKEALNDLLWQQKRELRGRIFKINDEFKHREMSRISHQQVIERFNDDVLNALEFEAEKELAQTERALERLAKDDYGYCQNCGNEISDERLRVLPHTQYCRYCAQSMEDTSLARPELSH